MRFRVPFSDWIAEEDVAHPLRPHLVAPHFNCETEAAFEQWRVEGRMLLYRYSLYLAILIYNSFLILDFINYRSYFWTALIVRLFVNTPLALLLIYFVPRLPSRSREALIASTHFVPALGLIYMSRGSALWIGEAQAAIIMMQMFISHAMRPLFRYFCVATGILFSADILFLSLCPELDGPTRGTYIGLIIVATTLSLTADYTMERKDRINFLLRQHNLEQNAQLSAVNDELARISMIDSLTGIANRRAFNSAFRTTWEEAMQKRHPLAILMMDLDFFKNINDRHGHTYGDAALKTVATALRDTLRSDSDMVARYGGEEFIALLPGRTLAEAIPIGERLCSAIRHLHLPPAEKGELCRITLSVGVASVKPSALMLATDLLRLADEALYSAKSAGRDRVCAQSGSLRSS